MHKQIHIARSLFALLLWMANIFALPVTQPDLVSASKDASPQAIATIDYTGCNGTPIAVTQKSKASDENSTTLNFAIDPDVHGADWKVYSSRATHLVHSFHSLASHLVYTETTTSRL